MAFKQWSDMVRAGLWDYQFGSNTLMRLFGGKEIE